MTDSYLAKNRSTLEHFRVDPIKFIQDHPRGFPYNNGTKDYLCDWSCIIHPKDLPMILELVGAHINYYYREDGLTWDKIYKCLSQEGRHIIHDYYLLNMNYEYLDTIMNRCDMRACSIYYIPKWFYKKHKDKLDYEDILFWVCSRIMAKFVLSQERRFGNTKRAI